MKLVDPSSRSPEISGNLLLFYVFDVSNDIDLEKVKQQHLVKIADLQLSSFFKHYHVPLSFKMDEVYDVPGALDGKGFSLSRKMYSFGVVSLCYRIPFEATFSELRSMLVDIKRMFDDLSKKEAYEIFECILPTVTDPHFYNLANSYSAIQVNPLEDEGVTAELFKERYGDEIASLLRFESQSLSDQQVKDILSSSTGYYGYDMIIVDSEAAFIYDNEYFEPLEFFESVSIQQLELQYFDQLLDRRLNYFYSQKSYKVPLLAYIPLISGRLELPVYSLAKLRVDISVITERLENSIKLTSDAYFTRFYIILVEKFLLKEWRDSINKKLDIIKDLYTVYQDRLDTLRSEILEVVIIILVAWEVFMFIK